MKLILVSIWFRGHRFSKFVFVPRETSNKVCVEEVFPELFGQNGMIGAGMTFSIGA